MNAPFTQNHGSTPIDMDSRRERKTPYSYCAVDRKIFNILYGDPRFDFSKRELRVILCVLNRMFSSQGVLYPVVLTNQDVAEATNIKKSHVSETIKDLLARRIVIREEGKTGLNHDIAEWLDKVPETGTTKFPKQELRVPETGTEKFPKQELEFPKQELGVPETGTPIVPSISGVADMRDRIEYHEKLIENNHEKPLEDLGDDSHLPGDLSGLSTSKLQHLAIARFKESGYAPPASSPDPTLAFKHQLDTLLLFKNQDDKSERIDDARYLAEFILPMIQDCPANLRVDPALWTPEFRMKLGVCRKNQCYMNPWPKKAKGGMAPHGNFNHIPKGTAETNF